jgi:hypothetical protein
MVWLSRVLRVRPLTGLWRAALFPIWEQMYVCVLLYLFFLLCVWVLRKTNAQESYQISIYSIHSSEDMRPYGALVYNALHLDRCCVTELDGRVCFLGGGGAVYWFCLSWHQHHAWYSINFLFSESIPLFQRNNANLIKDAPKIETYKKWHYFYNHLRFPYFEF